MRKDIFYILLLLIITDIVVICDINYLRQILPFIFFSTIPGYLLMGILKSDELKFLERLVLSLGLSLSLLMFTGLILNSIYPLLDKPLSLIPIIISLNVLMLILITIFYFKNDKIDLKFNFNPKQGILSPMIFSMLFPIITILGSYFMNVYFNNTILLTTLLLIPIYIVFLAILRKNIHSATYPVAIFNISLSLLLMNGLPSNYLIGRDIHFEYYYFKLTIQNNHWNMLLPNSYNACLSITILPAIYNYLLNINPIYIFKFYYGILGAFIPLGVYLISKKILKDNPLAFYAALLFIFQFAFIYILGWTRQLIALLFFTAAIMIIVSPNITGYAKKILFIIFIISTVFSHYTTAYIFLIIVSLIAMISWTVEILNLERYPLFDNILFKRTKELNYSKFTSISLALLFFVIIFAWYAQATGASFNDSLSFITNTLNGMANFFSEDIRNNAELSVIGIGLADIPNIISVYVHNAIFVIIGIGSLIILLKPEYIHYKLNREYTIAVFISIVFLASFLVLPFVSKGYGGTRLFTQLLVIISPLFIIGIQSITRFIKKSNLNIPLILTLLIILFSCTSYLQYHFYGIPYSYSFDNDSVRRYETYIYDSEVVGALWLNNYAENNSTFYTDAIGYSRILSGFDKPSKRNTEFFKKNKSIEQGYIYLGYLNLNKKIVFVALPSIPPRFINGSLKLDNVENIEKYDLLLKPNNLIYDNGGSQILI